MSPIKCRNRYIRAKAYRIACVSPGFIIQKKHDSWFSQQGRPVYVDETVKHPDFYPTMLREIKRLRAALAAL